MNPKERIRKLACKWLNLWRSEDVWEAAEIEAKEWKGRYEDAKGAASNYLKDRDDALDTIHAQKSKVLQCIEETAKLEGRNRKLQEELDKALKVHCEQIDYANKIEAEKDKLIGDLRKEIARLDKVISRRKQMDKARHARYRAKHRKGKK